MPNNNNISWRHHYLPKFYIKNFYKGSKKLWVYHKDQDRIQKEQKSAKSIFFEPHRNTIKFEEKTTNFIEDLYAKFDSDLAIIFNEINSLNREKLEDSDNFIAFLHSFINWLYWRIPSFDKINEEYIRVNNNVLKKLGEDKYPYFFSGLDPSSKSKLYKALIPFLVLRKKFITGQDKLLFRIYECEDPIFLLADNPLIIKRFPGLENIITNPVIIPISSNKLYFTLENEEYQINSDIIKQLNLILMYNADKYVASPNKEILEGFIRGYRLIKELPNIDLLITDLFDKINKRKNGS